MNDNINRYQGKASKHGKRVKSKRGKSDKSNKNLFGSRSGHMPTTPKPQPIPSLPTLKPRTPRPTKNPTPIPTPNTPQLNQNGLVIAVDDTISLQSGTSEAFIAVLENDTGSNLIVRAITSQPTKGQCTISLSLSEVVYIPNDTTFVGSDQCTYETCDDEEDCDTAIVRITIGSGVPPPPTPPTPPVTPSPVISWPTNPPFSFVDTPFPTSDSTPSVGTNKTMAPTKAVMPPAGTRKYIFLLWQTMGSNINFNIPYSLLSFVSLQLPPSRPTLAPTTSLAPTPYPLATLETPEPSPIPFTPFPTNPVECIDDAQCDDGKTCTRDRCVSDLCTHEGIPGCQVQGALLETFYGITGTAVSDLTNNPKYINNKPDKREIIQVNRDYERIIFLEVPADEAENYGSRLTTYVFPAASGWYNLGLTRGTGSTVVLYLSTDEDPANKVELENGTTGSTPIKLEAGKSYYVEALIIPGAPLNSISGNGQSLQAILVWTWYGSRDPDLGYGPTLYDLRSQFFLEPPISCSLNKECMRFNPSNDPCMQSLCDSETTLCNDVANLCEDGKVYCGINSVREGNDYAPTCAQCQDFYITNPNIGLPLDQGFFPGWYCKGDCTWSNPGSISGSCIDIATFNCGDSIRPQKEFAEGCVTEFKGDLNGCSDSNAYDTIKLGETVCGQLSSYTDVGGNIKSDRDLFRINFPWLTGKIKVKLELMPGDSINAVINLRSGAPCGSTSSSIATGHSELTWHNVKGDYQIEVSATNLRDNPVECGIGRAEKNRVHSYHLTVTQIDHNCIRDKEHCGTWRGFGGTDDGCYADKTSYNDSTRIGTSASLPILQHCLSEFFLSY